MDAKDLAQQIIDEVVNGERDMISPGNLQQVEITQQEAIDLGLKPPEESRWHPHTTLGKLKQIAKG